MSSNHREGEHFISPLCMKGANQIRVSCYIIGINWFCGVGGVQDVDKNFVVQAGDYH